MIRNPFLLRKVPGGEGDVPAEPPFAHRRGSAGASPSPAGQRVTFRGRNELGVVRFGQAHERGSNGRTHVFAGDGKTAQDHEERTGRFVGGREAGKEDSGVVQLRNPHRRGNTDAQVYHDSVRNGPRPNEFGIRHRKQKGWRICMERALRDYLKRCKVKAKALRSRGCGGLLRLIRLKHTCSHPPPLLSAPAQPLAFGSARFLAP